MGWYCSSELCLLGTPQQLRPGSLSKTRQCRISQELRSKSPAPVARTVHGSNKNRGDSMLVQNPGVWRVKITHSRGFFSRSQQPFQPPVSPTHHQQPVYTRSSNQAFCLETGLLIRDGLSWFSSPISVLLFLVPPTNTVKLFVGSKVIEFYCLFSWGSLEEKDRENEIYTWAS